MQVCLNRFFLFKLHCIFMSSVTLHLRCIATCHVDMMDKEKLNSSIMIQNHQMIVLGFSDLSSSFFSWDLSSSSFLELREILA